jgi:prepilin-type N-terminal cleavage/methylation domain-containing protein
MVCPLDSKNDGFTLVELLVSIAIFSVILGSIFSFSIAQRKYLSVQEQVSGMIQTARAAMDMISGELSVAGYSPSGAVFSGIPYNASQLQIYADLNGNGVVTDPNENIIYSYDANSKKILRNTGSGNQPMAENVQGFTFDYLNAQGNPTTLTANIRQIRITITVRTSKPDPQYTSNSGYRSYTLTSLVTPRNLAY